VSRSADGKSSSTSKPGTSLLLRTTRPSCIWPFGRESVPRQERDTPSEHNPSLCGPCHRQLSPASSSRSKASSAFCETPRVRGSRPWPNARRPLRGTCVRTMELGLVEHGDGPAHRPHHLFAESRNQRHFCCSGSPWTSSRASLFCARQRWDHIDRRRCARRWQWVRGKTAQLSVGRCGVRHLPDPEQFAPPPQSPLAIHEGAPSPMKKLC
jgi:hypothetical protein